MIDVEDLAEELGEEIMRADGFDTAIIGYTYRNGVVVLVYDIDKIVKELMDQGLTDEEAWEWYGYNIEPAYMGERTPIYMHKA